MLNIHGTYEKAEEEEGEVYEVLNIKTLKQVIFATVKETFLKLTKHCIAYIVAHLVFEVNKVC